MKQTESKDLMYVIEKWASLIGIKLDHDPEQL